MKKIVSTMFKCGAICASLNTVFADGDLGRPESTTAREVFVFKGSLEQFLREHALSQEYKYALLLNVVHTIEGISEKSGKIPNLDLAPNKISTTFCSEPYNLQFSFPENSTAPQEKYDPELFSEVLKIAFARLMLYVIWTEKRPYFEEGKIRIWEGEIQQYSENKWGPLEGDFTFVRLATRFLKGEIDWNHLIGYLESPENYDCLLTALKDVTTDEKRGPVMKMLTEIHKDKNRRDLISLLNRDVPKLLHQAKFLYFLKNDKDNFSVYANQYPDEAEELFDKCCRGEVQISKEEMEIFENWLLYETLLRELRIAAYAYTPAERAKARLMIQKMLTEELQDWLDKKHPELSNLVMMMQALDFMEEEEFCNLADANPELAMKILDACNKKEIQIDTKSMKILEEWRYDCVVLELGSLAYGFNIEEREEAWKIAKILHYEEVELEPKHKYLQNMEKLVRPLDTEDKDSFEKSANADEETRKEFLLIYNTGFMQFSESAKKIVKDFIKQQKLSTQSPATVSAN